MQAVSKVEVKPQGDGHSIQPRRPWDAGGAMSSVQSHEFKGSQYLVGKRAKKTLMKWHIFNIIRRLMVIAAAIQYIYVSMAAGWCTIGVLKGEHNPPESFRVFTATLISGYMGHGLIRNSPLVHNVLGNDTTPRDYALFLNSKTNTSTHNCTGRPKFNRAIYNYDFLSRAYLGMVNDTKYNITIFEDFELVQVVVDCSFTNLNSGDNAMVRFFNLIRSKSDPEDLMLVTMSLNVQDYEIPDRHKIGSAALSMITLVRNMTAGNVGQYYLMALECPYIRSLDFEVYEFVGITEDSYLALRSIPQDPVSQSAKQLITSRKRGFFNGQEQSNIRYMYTLLNSNATSALTQWEWLGEAVMSVSWAWVHGIHFLFGLDAIFSFVVLLLVMYQNFLKGKVWVGDPFASVSTAMLVGRGILVVISWYLNSFWMLFEFCMSIAGAISKTQIVRVHTELVHADVLVVYLGLVGLISSICRERIDPSIAIFLFEIIYSKHQRLLTIAAAVQKEVVTYSNNVFMLGVATPIGNVSPLRLWTAFQIPLSKDSKFLFTSFFPNAILLSVITGFAILRKIYRHYYPDHTRTRSSVISGDRSSVNERTALTTKGDLTNFEISTGAALQSRFGLISDYNNYVYFKGMKFASADGVYCSGYVIVNGKMLVAIKDLLSVVIIKAVGSRFTNVYVYEVEGNTVKDTARLVYPETLTWSDLWRLNLTVLL